MENKNIYGQALAIPGAADKFPIAEQAIINAARLPSFAEALQGQERKTAAATVANLLTLIAKDAGIREPIDAYTAARFLEIIGKYYAAFSIQDIKTAFELAQLGELDGYLPKDSQGQPDKNHYGVFSVEYYTKILNAYRRRRQEVRAKIAQALPAPTLTLPQLTDTEKRAYQRQAYIRAFRAFCRFRAFGDIMRPADRYKAGTAFKMGSILATLETMTGKMGKGTTQELIKRIFQEWIAAGADVKQIFRNKINELK